MPSSMRLRSAVYPGVDSRATWLNQYTDSGVDRAQDGVDEALGRGLLQWQVVPRTQARVDGQSDRKRQCRFLVENLNGLLMIVFFENEIILCQAGDRSAMCVSHRHEYVDQFDVDPERGCRFGLAVGVSLILLGWIGLAPSSRCAHRPQTGTSKPIRSRLVAGFLIE